MKLAKILAEKEKKGLITISADATLREAARKLCEHKIGSLLVTDPADPTKYVGIITERDILKNCCCEERCNITGKVSEIMTKNMIVATSQDNVEYVINVMTRHHIRHLPVIHEHKIVGMISMTDIIHALHQEDEIKIHYLSDFGGGTYGNFVY